MAAPNQSLAQSSKSGVEDKCDYAVGAVAEFSASVAAAFRGARLKALPLAPHLSIQHRAGGVNLSLTESEHHRSVSKREAVTVR